MISRGKVLPKEVIESWPEVFGDIKLRVVPLRYLHAVIINFKDGKVWEIKITAKTKRDGWENLEKSLSEMFLNYEASIDNIDFKIDTELVKRDVERKTSQFLKKRKL